MVSFSSAAFRLPGSLVWPSSYSVGRGASARVRFGEAKVPDSTHSQPLQRDTVELSHSAPVAAEAAAPPLNLHTYEHPFPAKVLAIRSLNRKIPDPAQSYSFEVDLDVTGSNFLKNNQWQLHPGQHVGVIPPGKSPDDCRWYSVGIRRQQDGRSVVRLLVRRVEFSEEYVDAQGKKQERIQKGPVSNYLASLNVGDTVNVMGPVHNNYIVPPPQRGHNMLVFLVGVALAPFLGGLPERFEKQKGSLGETHLYQGYKEYDHAPKEYMDTLQTYANNPDNKFEYATAFSREADSKDKRITDLAIKDGPKLLHLLEQDDTHVHIAGVQGMDKNVSDAICEIAAKEGKDGNAIIERLKARQHWLVEWGGR
jgi:NAD(P)H-flavin reductase